MAPQLPGGPTTPPRALTPRQRELVKAAMPMLDQIVAGLVSKNRGLPAEELRSVGVIALYEAAVTFREGKSASFLHYARCHVRGRLIDAITAERTSLRARVEHAMERAFWSLSAHQILDVDLLADADDKLVEEMRGGAADAVATMYVAGMLEGRPASPEEELIELEGCRVTVDAIAKALDKLHPHEREVIRRVYWEGESLAEVAAALGVHENTAHNRQKSALRKLRSLLPAKGG